MNDPVKAIFYGIGGVILLFAVIYNLEDLLVELVRAVRSALT